MSETASIHIRLAEMAARSSFMKGANAIVIAMAPEDADWKKHIETNDVVENILDILNDCRNAIDKDNFPTAPETVRVLTNNNVKWDEFCLRVIHHLKVVGALGSHGDYEEDFYDTANGCDEIVWDSVVYLIEHPEWSP